ncbi:MAG: putative polysaccharide biosynthesis protein [Eubacteriales bacterium]
MANPKKTFMQGALILICGNLLVKLIGAIYSVPLLNIIGETGYAYYQAAYQIYALLFVISTAGLPVAISKMVSASCALGKYTEVRRIFSVALSMFMVVGLSGFLFMYFTSDWIASRTNLDQAAYSVRALAPAVFFVAIMATYRGFFQGLQNMLPTALSEITEALCKLCIGLGCAGLLIQMSMPSHIVAAGAITGVTVGTFMSALVLTIIFIRSPERRAVYRAQDTSKERCRAPGEILKQLILYAVPITIGAAVMSLTNLIDLGMVVNRLIDVGFTKEEATFMYGAYGGMAQKLFNLPASLIFTIGTSAIPVISAAFATRDHKLTKSTIESALRICAMLAIPAGMGLAVLSEPILSLLFFSKPDGVAVAAPLLSRLGLATTFVCLVSLTNAMLQAVGLVNVPVFTMICGGVVKFIGDYAFIAIPSINIAGAPMATNLCYATIMVLNLYFIAKRIGVMPNLVSVFVKPLIAAVCMAVVAVSSFWLFSGIVGEKIGVLAAIGVAGLTYLGVLAVIRGFLRQDVKLLPKGDKIAAFLEKRKLLG